MNGGQTFPRPDGAVLSCIIWNLFYTLTAPCQTARAGVLALEGSDLFGRPAALIIGESSCEFRGDPDALERALHAPCRHMSEECANARK